MLRKRLTAMVLALISLATALSASPVFAGDTTNNYRYTYNYQVQADGDPDQQYNYSSYYNRPYVIAGYRYEVDVTSDYFTADSITEVSPDSDSRYLTEEEVRQYSSTYLLLARNEIYARKGYTFSNPDLARYFNYKTWYYPYGEWSDSRLNEYERYNIELICAEEARRGGAATLYWF